MVSLEFIPPIFPIPISVGLRADFVLYHDALFPTVSLSTADHSDLFSEGLSWVEFTIEVVTTVGDWFDCSILSEELFSMSQLSSLFSNISPVHFTGTRLNFFLATCLSWTFFAVARTFLHWDLVALSVSSSVEEWRVGGYTPVKNPALAFVVNSKPFCVWKNGGPESL